MYASTASEHIRTLIRTCTTSMSHTTGPCLLYVACISHYACVDIHTCIHTRFTAPNGILFPLEVVCIATNVKATTVKLRFPHDHLYLFTTNLKRLRDTHLVCDCVRMSVCMHVCIYVCARTCTMTWSIQHTLTMSLKAWSIQHTLTMSLKAWSIQHTYHEPQGLVHPTYLP
jgi:hypothetical protein